jgi:hypothetical protein
MKKVVLTVFFVILALAIFVFPAQSFNPAAHVYIADHLFPNHPNKTDLYYGSIAPDMAIYTNFAKWPDSFFDTHYKYMNLIPFAQGANQKGFARGWFTHNEVNGADYYAHGICDLSGNCTGGDGYGYVTIKSSLLWGQLKVLLEFPAEDDESYLYFAHFAIEAAIDLLLKEQYDHSLATKLLLANLLRSPLDRELLTKILVLKYRETDWINLITTELTFRNLVHQYATALALSNLTNKNALINLGVQLAQQLFGITANSEQLGLVLGVAIGLCQKDYYGSAIFPAIHNIVLP